MGSIICPREKGAMIVRGYLRLGQRKDGDVIYKTIHRPTGQFFDPAV